MKINYRPEIDGLRAIAVLSVIIYHAKINIANIKIFQGGFLGVDIFFVISGYLITSIILRNLHNKSFSILNFYQRRIRRIIPALVFVIIITLPLGWFYLLPMQLVEFSKSALFSLAFSSNIFFWIDGVEYIKTESLFKPYLHTWSLSVEEQYYLIIPFVLIFFYKKNQIFNILILILLMSFFHSFFSATKYPIFNFFSLSTRAWEIAAGSIIAYLELIKKKKIKNNYLNEIIVFFGLLLVFISILLFNDEIKYSNFLIVLPVIGICLILWFANKDLLIIKFLSIKIFVIIGLISYSLYLWHFPLFAFARITGLVEGSILNKIILIILLFTLSFLTYYFVEKKFRNLQLTFPSVLKFCFSIIFLIFLFNFFVISNNGYKNRVPLILSQIVNDSEYWMNFTDNKNNTCFNNIQGCEFFKDKKKKLYFIGDSHMATLIGHVTQKLKDEDYNIFFSTFMYCMHYPISINKKDCSGNGDYFKKLEKKLLTEKNSTIVLLGRYPLYLENTFYNNTEGGLENEGKYFDTSNKLLNNYSVIKNKTTLNFKKLTANNHKIILIYPIPEVGWDVPSKLYSKMPKNITNIEKYMKKENFITTSYEIFKERNKKSFEFLDKFQDVNIKRIYPHKLFCETQILGRCLANDSDNIFYSDSNHLSKAGNKLLVDLILSEL